MRPLLPESNYRLPEQSDRRFFAANGCTHAARLFQQTSGWDETDRSVPAAVLLLQEGMKAGHKADAPAESSRRPSCQRRVMAPQKRTISKSRGSS